MKVLYLVAGAGGMYCGACLHSNALAVAVQKGGEEVLVGPAYTPILTDEEPAPRGRLVFGGINVYLQEKWWLFRRTPWLFDRLLDWPGLVKWLGKLSSSRRPETLGALTVSMLRGEQGRQGKELDKMLAWLEQEIRPDVVHLSTAMLVGTVREIVRRLGVPVVTTLSGEDIFLERIPEPHYSEARGLLRERCAELSAAVALNGYFADFMAQYTAMPRQRIHVIRPGLNLAGYGKSGECRRAESRSRDDSQPVTVGYLARVCPEKGLHLLADAFALLAADQRLPPLRLLAGGYLDPADRPYLANIQAGLAGKGLAERFQYVGCVDRQQKLSLLESFDVMALPTVYAESKGISVLEAWASGVPVVLPAHGAFPEMIADTGGGLLCQAHDVVSLADALRQLILDSPRAAALGRQAQQAVHERYHADRMARETIDLYRTVMSTWGDRSR